ncbi:MAG: hypothetical protein JSW18_03235 [Candidatus Omnitrophota bacterium]|nr:MAG: hypothetical protein JSW18_03235 [Candidatus Omnitrophota bacterium]
MTKNTKETLLVVTAVILVILSIGLFISKEGQKGLKKEAAVGLNILRTSLNRLQDDFKDKEKLKNQFEKRLDELSRESASLEVQIIQIEKIYDKSEQQLAAIEKDMISSQQEIKDLLGQKKELTEKISSASSEVFDLENRLAILKQTTTALERHLKRMMRISGIKSEGKERLPQKAISMAGTEIEPAATEATSPTVSLPLISSSKTTPLKGEVLVVNREFNFIVISLGKRNGLKEGDRLKVYDNHRLLGEVSVETVRENISAASGGKDLDAYRLRPGNKVYLGEV